ncbi:hypothetical protein AB0E83_09355 [Streptomyces sp. NPDC035033]|uniref:hypothetical protein n=1 Tax=Streptomyces sp. NPDC035033 TaxID=3155368 RepID=UPI003403CDEB
MNLTRRLTLAVALPALAGQAFLTAAYLLWFLPVFSGGIGPAGGEGSAGGSAVPALLSLVAGAAAGALNVWSLRGLTRALRGGTPATRPFLVGAVVQLLVLAGAWVIDLTPLAATAALSLPLLLGGFLVERRHVRAG